MMERSKSLESPSEPMAAEPNWAIRYWGPKEATATAIRLKAEARFFIVAEEGWDA